MTETPIYDRLAFEMRYDREWKLQWMEAVAAMAAALPPPKASDLFPFLKKDFRWGDYLAEGKL